MDHILEQHLDTDELRIFNNNILRDFTLQNLIEQLIILEPKKLILYVQDMVERLQYLNHIRLNPRLLISLYLHISCMVERLVTHDPISSHEIQREFEEQHDDFIRMAKESFNQISVHYGVSIPVQKSHISMSTSRWLKTKLIRKMIGNPFYSLRSQNGFSSYLK